MKRLFYTICIWVFAVCIGLSQCPMCRMSVESNLKDGGTAGRTINTGILYMLIMPYLLVGTIGYIWYKNKKKAEKLEKELNQAQWN